MVSKCRFPIYGDVRSKTTAETKLAHTNCQQSESVTTITKLAMPK